MLRAFSGGSSPQTSSINVSAGHDLVRADQEVREHGTLLRPTEGDRAFPRVDLERSEDAELHGPTVATLPVHTQRTRVSRRGQGRRKAPLAPSLRAFHGSPGPMRGARCPRPLAEGKRKEAHDGQEAECRGARRRTVGVRTLGRRVAGQRGSTAARAVNRGASPSGGQRRDLAEAHKGLVDQLREEMLDENGDRIGTIRWTCINGSDYYCTIVYGFRESASTDSGSIVVAGLFRGFNGERMPVTGGTDAYFGRGRRRDLVGRRAGVFAHTFDLAA